MIRILVLTILSTCPVFLYASDTAIGKRPYEMIDAGRNVNPHPPTVDFENSDGWSIETTHSEARFEKSREEQLWGDHVGKLTYRATGDEKPIVVLKPPKPIPLTAPLDCIGLWVCGNNWDWAPDPETPRTEIFIVLKGRNDKPVHISIAWVRWKEWFLCHRKLNRWQLEAIGDDPCFEAIEIHGGTNREERTLYFDDLSFYRETSEPLSFQPRPKRGIELPEGQTIGANTGPGRLPFPNRKETILPSVKDPDISTTLAKPGNSYKFESTSKDGTLIWTYTPKSGGFDDLKAIWQNNGGNKKTFSFRNSGLRFTDEKEREPKLLELNATENDVTARWKFGDDEVVYRFELLKMSLIVDVRCLGGIVKEVAFGQVVSDKTAKCIKVPYLTGHAEQRPLVLMNGTEDNPLFFLQLVDHTRSNASELFFENSIKNDNVVLNGGSRYWPRTDGKHNDCFERLFFNISSRFDEVLPEIPNNPSPWKNVTGKRVWRSYGAGDRKHDIDYWKRVHRYGLRNVLIVDHETMWRDGGESFTFRTTTAPERGGDAVQKEYTEKIHDLGYVYGPYNNYTDIAPVNESWSEDRVTRTSDGNWRQGWTRCYNPKPSVAVQLEPKITEIIQRKFHFNTAYCDVHTAVPPWNYVDYDHRVPGAGTFAATFFAYGEIMLHQKKIWAGPVYSEGGHHWYYSGLTDGNYAQDRDYDIPNNPWLVDFDLLRIHPLECNFGMGNRGMFFGPNRPEMSPEEQLDRFLAATLAFGHTGFLDLDNGLETGTRSYFALQQLQIRYADQTVTRIRYGDPEGRLLETSQALLADIVRHNFLSIEYENGFKLYVNGNPEKIWNCKEVKRKISPNGWFIVDPKNELTAWSLDFQGHRCDYVDSPQYLFADVRANPSGGSVPEKPARFKNLLCDKQLIVLKNIDERNRYEMIVGESWYSKKSTVHAVRLENDSDADVIALDFERNELGPAKTRFENGMVHVLPVEGAVSYILTPKIYRSRYGQ